MGLGIILAVSANWVVKSTAYFSKRLHVQSFLLGFLILGFATTIPEMFVAYQAVRDGVPQLSVGNLLGGSILLLSFIMGGSALFLRRIILDHGMTTRDIGLSTLVVAMPAVVLWDGRLTRFEGIILILVYIIHIGFINREQHFIDRVEHHAKNVKHSFHALMLGMGGLVGLAFSSRFIVTIGEGLARQYSISPFVIGLFLITFGTNLPELTLAVEAIIKKKRDIAFGDVLGSAVINTPILGVICVFAPFSVPDHLRMRATLILLAGTALFFWWAASSKRDITRREGIVLFILYFLFVAFEMMKI
ncbi:MAG: Na+/Ca+ antiporter, CaCA family [Candidatus Gottesmanbacteria bacterium GW2011_GWA2_44_17]|uniref:Na+/Ca+ antiporter, CaCA family n=2 Tax=Candidatus Gottesmaniibacteriota TaxID=1752720 RepID=A0A0G1LG06_9BACT|nr:MAG: Na+/Ca+ antiporter, CaCA family [Microgenomates group bacterium GW2011_GWC1_43_11]KKT46477.1 MAG: Na+/Ca+ antiporter, CaCA family [Candidatus Gottesmanbacteria bacterium GW2011_GWA2_44_17]KKT58954.1 MAG: Na+/Ca+ antiporter, CaCA family [Candidatus Gottesmanbacteria bacterium GW2011_GWA1_44_24b]